MKIIKQFESNEWAKSCSSFSEARLKYGLGDDGRLYIKGSAYSHWSYDWMRYEDSSLTIPLTEMVKIVREFEHLLVWL
jgi:hypothetical protein